jgi:hypothetical protein
MNQRDLATRNFRTKSQVPYGERLRRRRRYKTVLLALLAVVIIVLIIAVVFIVRDIVIRAREERESGGHGAGASTSATAPDVTGSSDPSADHPVKFAVDADDSTFMLSESNQATGAWLQLDLGAVQPVAAVSLISNHHDCFIRSADVEYSTDGQTWATLGEFSGTPDNPVGQTFTMPAGTEVRFVRLILTSGAAKPWAVNSFHCKNNFGNVISVQPSEVTVGMKKSSAQEGSSSSVQTGYENRIMSFQDIYKGFLILVNTSHYYVFPETDFNILSMYENRTSFAPSGAHSFQLGDTTTTLLDATAMKALNDMCDAFYTATGISALYVGPNNGYRSRETQEKLWAADPVNAAKAGASDHNTGYAVNLDIFEKGVRYSLDDPKNSTAAATLAWLTSNAYRYGFCQRYPAGKDDITGGVDFDRYHYRYVGYAHAYYMTVSNLCLEEYLELLEKNYSYSQKHLSFKGDDGRSYEIYFVPAGNALDPSVAVPVPSNYPYTISGNNYSGFVVTVTR